MLVLCLLGCAPPPESPPLTAPRQEEAVQLVWHDMLGREEPPPELEWVFAQPCKGSRWGSVVLEPGPNGSCDAGNYSPAQHRVTLVIPSASPATDRPFGVFSSSAMVHEFVHAMLTLEHGDGDGGHTAYPAAWAVVPFANNVIAADGL